jgi:hypothetical protein
VRDGIDASDLRIPITSPVEAEVQLLIDDGSNAPLEVKRIVGQLAQLPVIYFEAPAGDITARYGDRGLAAPAYDLEAVRDSLDITRFPEARWGNVRSLGEAEPVPSQESGALPGGTIDASGFRHVRSIGSTAAGLCALPLDAAALAGSRGPAHRFADVRILDEKSRQIPYLLERRDEPLHVDVQVVPAQSRTAELQRAPGRQLTVYKITLPYADLPPSTILLETSVRVFQRNVQLGVERPPDRRRREAWFEPISSATWRHANKEIAPQPLALRIDPADQRELLLAVDEGDNAPLPITSARLLLPSYRLRFYHPGAGALRLAYGRDDLRPPQYDLALLAQQVMGAPAREVVPGAAAAESSSPSGERSFISPVTFWILLGSAVLVLVGLIARLVKQAPR